MYNPQELIKLAKRDNNPNRDYLLINIFQGKHYPVNPRNCFEMCQRLAAMISEEHGSDRLLLIGFAEAATAIGAIVADFLNVPYIQTTREIFSYSNYISFSEDHSHAKEQRLYTEGLFASHKDFDRIVFIEDEITTGNTLKNVCRVLNEFCEKELRYTIASLLDCTCDFQKLELLNLGINIISLMKLDKQDFAERLNSFVPNGINRDYSLETIEKLSITERKNVLSGVTELSFTSKNDAVFGIYPSGLKSELNTFAKCFFAEHSLKDFNNFLVLGTEEFMFPSLLFGNILLESAPFVNCHSTARSPMLSSNAENYPIKSRYCLPSVYEDSRKTFVYNLKKADCTFVFTDSKKRGSLGMVALVKALKDLGNERIFWIWWDYEKLL